MHTRLRTALDALGYDAAQEPHYRSDLIHAIQLFAILQRDGELEAACDEEIERIRVEVIQRPVPKK